ncbi:DUF2235 domain-containing protein [Paracoccus caeni]|uniref:DUF2235 domain-containing protein n=1 Tax=Paracoccus caeni TaxID=657651 RepID=A0A934W0G6_9RHOB|nr:DUF2235 domain-containing protein [Paracoccus caeni]MBK4216915.1 DUF2235 domain-containing protein [Paracoccus caeni]
MFFDGTFNNLANARTGGTTGSYANAASNVALLSQIYKDGDTYDIVNEWGTGVCRKFGVYYAKGIGTRSGGKDSKIGGALGMGETGVEYTVANAALDLGQQIARMSPGIEPEEILLDVFGFSRGAAAARYFVNAFRQGWVDYNPVFGTRLQGRVPEGRKFRIRFVGIFETVASIGLGTVEYNYGANIHLKTAQADKIFHMVAVNEYRRNFRLNDNHPSGGDRQEMPGAHSDVGGGYRDPGDTAPLAGSKKFMSPWPDEIAMIKDIRSQMGIRPEDAVPWIEEGFIRPDQTSALQHRIGPVREEQVTGAFGAPTTMQVFDETRVLHRPWVRLGLSRVAMAAMHRRALELGVPLLDLPSTEEYTIPPDLRPIGQRIIAGEEVGGADARFVVNNFVHVSANPDSIGMSGESDREREIYPNQPGKAI